MVTADTVCGAVRKLHFDFCNFDGFVGEGRGFYVKDCNNGRSSSVAVRF